MKRKDLGSNEDITNPQGSNKLNAYGSFYFRDVYDCFIFKDAECDFWYKNGFFGRVNDAKEPVVVNERYLRQLTTGDDKTVLALPPVVEAWKALVAHMNKAIFRGDIDPEKSLFGNLKPVRGWYSSHMQYKNYNSTLYDVFTGDFMSTPRDHKIKDFKSFVDVFLEFTDRLCLKLPWTREGFHLSYKATPHYSGMFIEIAEVPHDLDSLKASFLADRNFSFFKKAANRHGFKLDKNAPWRLVPDLESRGMARNMKKVQTNREIFYDDYFIKTYQYELENFKHFLWGWYNGYVSANPVVQVIDLDSGVEDPKLLERVSYTEEELFAEFSDHYFLKLYAYVRAKEVDKNWNQATFSRIVYRAREILRVKGKDTAMKYLHENIDPCSTPKTKQDFEKKDLTNRQLHVILDERLAKRSRSFSYYQ